MLLEYEPVALACLKAALKSYHNNHYYIFFTSTLSSGRHKGLCTSVTQFLQQKAEDEKVPIWLEATTLQAKEYFARLGFEVTEEFVLGKGKVDGNGDAGKGGDGVKGWGMVWWPVCLRGTV